MSLRGTKQSVGLMQNSLMFSSRKMTDCFVRLAMTGLDIFLLLSVCPQTTAGIYTKDVIFIILIVLVISTLNRKFKDLI